MTLTVAFHNFANAPKNVTNRLTRNFKTDTQTDRQTDTHVWVLKTIHIRLKASDPFGGYCYAVNETFIALTHSSRIDITAPFSYRCPEHRKCHARDVRAVEGLKRRSLSSSVWWRKKDPVTLPPKSQKAVTTDTCHTAKRILIHFLSAISNRNKCKSAQTRLFSNILVKLGPDYSCSYSGSGLWLVRMWTGSRAPIQAAQAPTVVGTSKGGSQAFKGRWYVQLSWHAVLAV
jgi:hypothetical protein